MSSSGGGVYNLLSRLSAWLSQVEMSQICVHKYQLSSYLSHRFCLWGRVLKWLTCRHLMWLSLISQLSQIEFVCVVVCVCVFVWVSVCVCVCNPEEALTMDIILWGPNIWTWRQSVRIVVLTIIYNTVSTSKTTLRIWKIQNETGFNPKRAIPLP